MATAAISYYSGQTYGMLMLTGKSFQREIDSRKMVEVICDCGVIRFSRYGEIASGKIKSCGCVKIKHGMATINHPLYRAWRNIINRCYQKSHRSYVAYGGIGLTVYEAWLHDFKAFYDWAIANGWQEGLTIERKKNNDGYNPTNCKWATQAEQNRNKCNNVFITAFGETKCLQDWVEDARCSVGRTTILCRIHKWGWSTERAIQEIKDRKLIPTKSKIELSIFGEIKCVAAWARDKRCLVSINILRNRIKEGWNPELSLTTKGKKHGITFRN